MSRRPAAQTDPPYARVPARAYGRAGLIVLATLAAYLPAFSAGFIWDDDDHITLNPLVTEPGGLGGIWNPWSPLNPQYYPLVFTTFRIEYALWGADSPAGYHAVNVVLHALNAGLLLLILTRLRLRHAWVVAAAFALHPVCVESVAWVTERKNTLSALFYLLAVLAWLRYDEAGRTRWATLTVLCFVAALFSKTAVVALPLVLGLVLWYRRRPLRLSRLAPLGLMLVIGLLFALLTRAHEHAHMTGEATVLSGQSLADRVLLAGRAFWFYPAKVLWPTGLSFMYPRWEINPHVAWQWLYPLAGVIFALLLLGTYARKWIGRGPLAAATFYAVTIFPALGFVNVAFMRFSSTADHFQYLASIGTLLLVVGTLARIWRVDVADSTPVRLRSAAAVAAGLLLVLGGLSFRRALVFQDSGSLWADTATKSPTNYMAQVNYGGWLKEQGRNAEAAARFQRAIDASPAASEGTVLGFTNLAAVQLAEGRYKDALRSADAALAVSPGFPFALLHKGRALWRLGRYAEAEASLLALTSNVDPEAGRIAWDFRRRISDADIYSILADVQRRLGKTDAALLSYQRTLAANPRLADVQQARLLLLSETRQYGAAIAAARAALPHLLPETADRVRLHLAWLLATAPGAADRNGTEAARLARDLVGRLGQEHPVALSVLAAAQAEIGEFEAAAGTARCALALAERDGHAPLLARLRAQLNAYNARTCLREPE